MIPCLLITADPAVRDTVKVGLDQLGSFEIELAEDMWAVEMVRNRPYRVVVCDATLADGSDGLEVLRRIREVSGDAELLFICRDRTLGRNLGREKQQLGLYGVLYVPVEPVEFFRTLARLMERLGASVAA
jgi:CheY-like chemotaxis protein